MKTLYLCGAGNSEGVRLALAINRAERRWSDIVLLDDDPRKHGNRMLDVKIAGPIDALGDIDPEEAEVANLVARTTEKRRHVRDRLAAFSIPFARLLSPEIDTLGVELAGDVMAYQNAILGPEVSIDEGTVVFMGGIVGHESIVGKCCVIAANSVLNARVRLEDRVYFGTNATALPEVTIGEGATIGAGSVVIQDVPAGATAIGVPAQIMTIEPSHATAPSNGEAITPIKVKPAPDVERLIARIWGDVLQTEHIGMEQTFFDLGGDSLLALRVCERLKAETGSNLCIMDVFHYPTVRALAGRFQQDANGRREPTDHEPPAKHDRASRRRSLMQRRNVSQH